MALLRAVRFAGGTAEVLLEPPRDRVVFRALAAWSKARACARCSGWLTQNATRRRIAVARLESPRAGETSTRPLRR